jgi:hypothetical protein
MIFKDLLNPVKEYIKGQAIHTVDISGIQYDISLALAEIFHSIDNQAFTVPSQETVRFENTVAATINHGVKPDIVFYRGVPIWITDNPEVDRERTYHYCAINTINEKYCISVLYDFIKKLYRRNNILLNKADVTKFTEFVTQHRVASDISYRTFDDIFVDEKIKNVLLKHIDSFASRKKWYKEHNIPYHYGIMLYGAPGTGKSVLAQAIASYLNSKMYVISGDNIFDLPDILGILIPAYMPSSRCRIVLCEDIDCGLKKSADILDMLKSDDYRECDTVESVNTKRDRRKAGFSSLLNAMDGLGAPEDIIYIFTTNNIDDIDPALIRPGRIDLKLEIGYVTRDQFDQFTMKYFDKVSDEKFDIKDNMSFANIQNEMMKGSSFEEIVNFVRKE